MITAHKSWTVVEYEKGEETFATDGGILVPTARSQRLSMKGKTKTISADPDAELPDLIRIAAVVSSDIFTEGAQVFFNKHDGYGFDLDGHYYYALKSELVMGAITE